MLRDQRGELDHFNGLQVEVFKLTTSFLGQEAVAELEAGLATLLEMFPHSCRVEAAHCLTLVSAQCLTLVNIGHPHVQQTFFSLPLPHAHSHCPGPSPP